MNGVFSNSLVPNSIFQIPAGHFFAAIAISQMPGQSASVQLVSALFKTAEDDSEIINNAASTFPCVSGKSKKLPESG